MFFPISFSDFRYRLKQHVCITQLYKFMKNVFRRSTDVYYIYIFAFIIISLTNCSDNSNRFAIFFQVLVKASEEEVLIITVKVVPAILMAVVTEEVMVREVRIPTVVEAETLTVAVAEVDRFIAAVVGAMTLMVAVAEVDRFIAAVVEAMTLIVAVVGAVMVVTGVKVPLEMTKIIRAITMLYRCPEHRETVPDQDAAYPSVSPRRDRGLVFSRIDNKTSKVFE